MSVPWFVCLHPSQAVGSVYKINETISLYDHVCDTDWPILLLCFTELIVWSMFQRRLCRNRLNNLNDNSDSAMPVIRGFRIR